MENIKNKIKSDTSSESSNDTIIIPKRKMKSEANVVKCRDDFIDSLMQNRVVLSIGTKGSGKTYLMLNFLKYALKNKLFQRYVLVLPAYGFEESDSYGFINVKDPNIFVFEGYNEVITKDLMKQQKNEKTRKKTLFIIDDASGENVWRLDASLQKMITVVRHLHITLWIIVHSASGILSPFLRQQCDILLLSKMTNTKLLENIWEEYLSMTKEYKGREGHKKLIDDFIELHEQKFKVMYLDLRKNLICMNAGEFRF